MGEFDMGESRLSHLFGRASNLPQWSAVVGVLFLLLGLSGCALQGIDDKVTNNGHDIRELRDQIVALENSVKRPGDDQHDAELRSRIEQLIESSQHDSKQIRDLGTLLIVLGGGSGAQDQPTALAVFEARELSLETKVATLQSRVAILEKPSSAIRTDDPQAMELVKEISATEKEISSLLTKLTPSQNDGGTYSILDDFAGELMYYIYLLVMGLLMVFLVVCFGWGICKAHSLIKGDSVSD